MLDSLIVIIAFSLGFIFGAWERKVDRLSIKVKLPSFTNNSEIVKTPGAEVLKKEKDKAFYDNIK